MYQWQSPQSGRVQLSGSVPSWYRANERGPRVLVFENGQLIDDTALPVSEMKRLELRESALAESATGAASDSTSLPDDSAVALPAQELKLDTGPAALADPAPASPAAAMTPPDSAKAAQLKALIDAWDDRQLEQARSLLELMPDSDDAAGQTVPAPR